MSEQEDQIIMLVMNNAHLMKVRNNGRPWI